MGQISIRGTELVALGEPPYDLPEEVDSQFLQTFFASQPGDECFIGEVMRHFSEQDKLDLKLTAKRMGGPAWAGFCRAAGKWAAVVNQDNCWHMEDFTPLYEAEINSAWAYNVIITHANIRFVTSDRGLMTFPEFRYQYGMDIIQHLDELQERTVQGFTQIKRHISSELVKRLLLVTDRRGNIVKKTFSVLESLPRTQWALPKGYSFVAEAEVD